MDAHIPAAGATGTQAPVLPRPSTIAEARSKLLSSLPKNGLGCEAAIQHLQNDLVPGLNRASESPNFYGFVTGGSTPAASHADNIVTETDQNVQVHLPNETLCTDVEDRALRFVCELLDLPAAEWTHRTFTTGATASNIVGLACGREHVVAEAARRLDRNASVAGNGIFKAMNAAGLDDISILTTVPHSSLRKAASILGLGHASVIDVGQSRTNTHHLFDFNALKAQLEIQGQAAIVAVSCAEVNTGLFATQSYAEMARLRALCDHYGAWLHVDAAFGLLARLLPPNSGYDPLLAGVAGLELADSIAGDAHKLLNVPYDCGIFLSRHLSTGTQVFQNPNAAYLNSASTETHPTPAEPLIPSPLNIGLENSRRFRALPVYATLAAYGREGYREMLERQIGLARGIATFIHGHEGFELLPASEAGLEERLGKVYIIVLFRARDEELNRNLVKRIDGTGRVYVSGTQWEGRPACRFAVANWQVRVERDLEVVRGVLEEIVRV